TPTSCSSRSTAHPRHRHTLDWLGHPRQHTAGSRFGTVEVMEATAFPSDGERDRFEFGADTIRRAVKIAVAEAVATYLVRRALESGHRRLTGRPLPTARDRDVPFRQVMVWASVTGAALSAATVLVDQFALLRD